MRISDDPDSLCHVSNVHDVNLIPSLGVRRVPLWLTLVELNCVAHLRIIPRVRMYGDLFQPRLLAPVCCDYTQSSLAFTLHINLLCVCVCVCVCVCEATAKGNLKERIPDQ